MKIKLIFRIVLILGLVSCSHSSDNNSITTIADGEISLTPSTETCNGIDDDGDGLLAWWEFDNDIDSVAICGGDCDDRASTFVQSTTPTLPPASQELPSTAPELLQVIIEELRSADVHNLVVWLRSELPDDISCLEESVCIASTWPIDKPNTYVYADLGPQLKYSATCAAPGLPGAWSSGYWRIDGDPFEGTTENSTSTWVDGASLTVSDSARLGGSYTFDGVIGTQTKWHKYGDHLHRETDDHSTSLLGTFGVAAAGATHAPLYEGVGVYDLTIDRGYKEEVVSYPGPSWEVESATLSGSMTWDSLGAPAEIIASGLSWSYRHDWDTAAVPPSNSYNGCETEPLIGSLDVVRRDATSGAIVFSATVTFDGAERCDGCGELVVDSGPASPWCPIGGFFPAR